MEKEYWVSRWEEGKTGFHQSDFNKKLIQYFSTFDISPKQKVFVPLCGKSKDMLWLRQQGLEVHGIELHKKAVEEFFAENNLSFNDIQLSCGDFFSINDTPRYDFIYDRAALVALPASMRPAYAQKIGHITKDGGRCLLLTYEYNQEELEGPPFSVSEEEVHSLYAKNFSIQLIEDERPKKEGPRLEHLKSLTQKVYILKRVY